MKTRISTVSLVLLLGVVIVSGCTLAIAETPEAPTAVPTESPPESEGEAVEGWTGRVIDLPAGNQFGQIFEREDGEEFGIATPTEVGREQIAEARSTGARVKVWGTLHQGAPADEARTIEVERLEFLSEPSGDDGEPVEGWIGRVIDLPAGNQFGQIFEREDGEEFGIATPTEEVRERVVEARSTGARVQVWGTLHTGVPADEARTIEVERLEFLSEPPADDGEPVEGWIGRVIDLPAGNQFGQIFEREDGEEFGIATPTEEARDQVVEARSTGARVQVWGTLHTGVPADEARTIEVERLEFLSERPADDGEPVEGWIGRVIDLPAGNQFGQVFEREDGEEFDIATPTEEARERVVEARSTGARVQVWGTLHTGVPADEARTIEVERLEFLSEPPADDGESVEGWTGTVYQLPPGSQFGRSFVRDDGEEYGIGTTDDALRDRINEAAWVGARIKVWGRPHTGVPATEARQIEVTRLEVLSEAAPEPRRLSPFAQLSASSHLPADRYGTYGPYAAIDGSKETSWVEGVDGPGTGEWIQLTFPGSIELHALGFDVGFDKNADLFVKNNRIKKATLIFSNGEQTSIDFEDTRGMQEFAMVRAPGPNVETTFIKVIIEDIYPGTEYDDTGLAEIEVWGIAK